MIRQTRNVLNFNYKVTHMTNFVTYVLYGASDIIPLSDPTNERGSSGDKPAELTFDDNGSEEQ